MKSASYPCWIFFLSCALFSPPFYLEAAPSLHPLFVDRAVLQIDVPLPFVDTARPGEKNLVSLECRKASAIANIAGQWQVGFASALASTKGLLFEARGKEDPAARASDILIGEVWLPGGQSNIRHFFQSYSLLKDSPLRINNPKLRLLIFNDSAKTNSSSLIHPICEDNWQIANCLCIGEFSHAGCYFRAALRRERKITIGFVLSAFGGRVIEHRYDGADYQLDSLRDRNFIVNGIYARFAQFNNS